MKKDEKMVDETNMVLEVEESPISAKGGVARVNEDTLSLLNMEEGKSAVVKSKTKSVMLTIYADSLIEKNKIKIRKPDLKKLAVSKGDEVSITTSKPLTDVIKSKFGMESKKEEEKASK
ncbi:MAG: hypothetical protein JSV49_10655 [Thermoplasmata archaeon]|nr:MAG: hypothetical protein JSV49_10655 [Thermoplasmata archaeon]